MLKILSALFAASVLVMFCSVSNMRLDGDVSYQRIHTEQHIRSYRTAVSLFAMDFGRIPTEREGLEILSSPRSLNVNAVDSYIDGGHRDDWGSAFVYRVIGPTADKYSVYSKGPNQLDEGGFGDDVVIGKTDYRCEDFDDCREPVDYLLMAIGLSALLSGVALVTLVVKRVVTWTINSVRS